MSNQLIVGAAIMIKAVMILLLISLNFIFIGCASQHASVVLQEQQIHNLQKDKGLSSTVVKYNKRSSLDSFRKLKNSNSPSQNGSNFKVIASNNHAEAEESSQIIAQLVEQLIDKAEISFAQDDYVVAGIYLEQAMKLSPNTSDIYYRLAKIKVKEDNPKRAAELAELGLSKVEDYRREFGQVMGLRQIILDASTN